MRKFILILTIAVACTTPKEEKSSVVIFSLHDQQSIDNLNLLNLDEQYPNLLDPRVSSQEQLPKVIESWNEFHQQIGNKLKERGFEWETEESVKLVNKIYFNMDSEIEFYAFRVLNDVPAEKIIAFNMHMEEILPSLKINLNRAEKFAQCGKVKYQN